MHLAVLLIYALLVAVIALASGSAMGWGGLVFDWHLLAAGALVGALIYAGAVVLYYVLFCDDVLVVDRHDLPARRSLIWINRIRESIGRLPLWAMPADVREKQLLCVARDCLLHIQEELSLRPARGRASRRASALQGLARRLGKNLIQALWSVSWSQEMIQKLEEASDNHSQHIAAIRRIEERDRQRFQRSFDSLVALATALAELGSEIQDGDMERLLGEFGEIAVQMEEDAQALQEVRRSRLV